MHTERIEDAVQKTSQDCVFTINMSHVVSSKQAELGLTQEFSRISESTTGYIFTPCVGSFISPGIDTR